MKKILLLFVAASALGLTSRAADGDKFVLDGLYYQVTSEANFEVSLMPASYYSNPPEGDVVIPGTVTYNSKCYTVTATGQSAFSNCTGLTSVVIPETVTNIGHYAFKGCSNLKSIDIPASVTEIGGYAFEYCSKLTSVYIPASVTELWAYVFHGCDSLNEILVDDDNPTYSSEDGVLFNKNKTILYQCPGAKQGSYGIPGTVTIMSSYAFYNCKLTSVTIPNSVTKIYDSTFWSSDLTSITIPASVTEIGKNAFYYCRNLADVHCYAVNPPTADSASFDRVTTSKVTLHVLPESVEAYKAAAVWKNFNIIGDLTLSGVDGVEAEDSDAPAEYFNLNGMRVNGDALTPGLYIKRQGSNTSKVLVK